MVRDLAGLGGGMRVRRWFVPPSMIRPLASNAQPVSSPTAPNRIISNSSSRETKPSICTWRALVHLADPDQPQVGLGCDRPHLGNRIDLEHLGALRPLTTSEMAAASDSACALVRSASRPTVSKKLAEPVGRDVSNQRHDLVIGTVDRRDALDRGPHRSLPVPSARSRAFQCATSIQGRWRPARQFRPPKAARQDRSAPPRSRRGETSPSDERLTPCTQQSDVPGGR